MGTQSSEADTPPPAETAERRPRGETALALSNAIVGLYREHAGRGPNKAKALISPEVAVITLGDCLTKAERTLADNGDHAPVMQMRAGLHEAMRGDAVAAVEEITGRQVVGYFTDQQLDPDVGVMVFIFAAASTLKAV